MKHWFALILIPMLIACSGADAETAERMDASAEAKMSVPDLADRMIDDGKTLGDMLARVDSAEAARDIRPAIEEMAETYRDLIDRIGTMDSPSFSDMAALASRAKPLAETQELIAVEVQRIYADHPEAADVLRAALGDLGQR